MPAETISSLLSLALASIPLALIARAWLRSGHRSR
jgi:hypothetical protein